MDKIALIQPKKRVAAEEFQAWKLVVRPDRTAMLKCEDGDGTIVQTKGIKYKDFPLDQFTFYFTNGVVYLPSEH